MDIANLTEAQIVEWLMANPASSVLTQAKELRRAQAEAKSKAYGDATSLIKGQMMAMLDDDKHIVFEAVGTLIKQGFIGLRVELPITDFTDEAGNGLASSVVGLVVGPNGRMRVKRGGSGNPGSRSAKRTHRITDDNGEVWAGGEWAGYIDLYGSLDERATYAEHKNRAGKIADKIAGRLNHTNEYI